MSRPLEGRVVVVTGAARGIGRGIARAAAEAGAHVGLIDVDAEGLTGTAKRVEETGHRAMTVVADVVDPEAMEGATDRIVEGLGRLDGWVNNAGVIEMAPAVEITHPSWGRHAEVNAWGVLNGCQVAARWMISHGAPGAIVNVASNAGKVGYANMAAYNASKAAVINLTRTLAAEWSEHGINVNAVCPGGVETPMLREAAAWVAERIDADAGELFGTMKPALMDRHVQPIDVGRVVAFLLSDAAAIIRGQSINVDGGDTPY